MKIKLFVLFFTCISLNGLTVFAQKEVKLDLVEIKGVLLSANDSTPISYVHIVDLSTGFATICDQNGNFSFRIDRNDTIRFSAVGFETLLLNLGTESSFKKKFSFTIFMKEKIYKIDEILVRPYANFSDFKYAFINLELPEDKFAVNLNLPNVADLKFKYDPRDEPIPVVGPPDIVSVGASYTIEGPITKLYDKYSRKGKGNTKFHELVAIAPRYNKDVIKRVTGLKDESEILSFMFFCDLSHDFIQAATDYEIVAAINECYEEYTKQN